MEPIICGSYQTLKTCSVIREIYCTSLGHMTTLHLELTGHCVVPMVMVVGSCRLCPSDQCRSCPNGSGEVADHQHQRRQQGSLCDHHNDSFDQDIVNCSYKEMLVMHMDGTGIAKDHLRSQTRLDCMCLRNGVGLDQNSDRLTGCQDIEKRLAQNTCLLENAVTFLLLFAGVWKLWKVFWRRLQCL